MPHPYSGLQAVIIKHKIEPYIVVLWKDVCIKLESTTVQPLCFKKNIYKYFLATFKKSERKYPRHSGYLQRKVVTVVT